MKICRSRARQLLTQCLTAGSLATWQLGCGYPVDETESEAAPTVDEISNPVIGGCCGTNTVDPGINGFRLSTTPHDPVHHSGASSSQLYLVPYTSNMISLYDGNAWVARSAVVTVSSSNETYLTNTYYNVFAYWDGQDVRLELIAEPSPAYPALNLQDSIQVKSGDASRRYVGVARTVGSSFVDTPSSRLVWNRYNQVARHFDAYHNTTWSFSGTNSWRPVGGNSNNGRAAIVAGSLGQITRPSTSISITTAGMCTSSQNGYYAASGIGIDSTTVNSANIVELDNGGPSAYAHLRSAYNGYLSPGYHTINWLEIGQTGSTFACIGYAYSPPFGQLGLTGMVTN